MSNAVDGRGACLHDAKDGAMRDTLIVLEQQALVREALVALLASARASSVVRGAGSMADAAPMLLAAPGCLLLLDIEGCGPEATLEIMRARFPTVRIVALAARETRDGVLRCLAARAHGFVAKTAAAADLVRAVQMVEAGGVHVPAGLVAPVDQAGDDGAGGNDAGDNDVGMASPSGRGSGRVVDQLTGRQRDVLLLMAEGRSTKDIARTLDLAVSTIKVHLAGVYRTVGARNRVEALCRAGLLPQKLAA